MSNTQKRDERPLTAQPVGRKYAVVTAGLSHTRGAFADVPAEDVSDNFIEMDAGCYRREPTCKD